MEQTMAEASNTESTEREDFAKAEARLDEIKGMKLGDMSDDDLENVMVERKALRAQKEEMIGNAQVEAAAEDQERSNAEKIAAEAAEIAKAEAEATAQAEKAKQIEERQKADVAQAEVLLAEIKGTSVEKKENTEESEAINAMVEAARAYRNGGGVDRTQYDATWKNIPDAIKKEPGFSEKVSNAMKEDGAKQELAQEKPKEELQSSQEQISTPEENIMILKYGEKMRQDADQLVDVVKQIAGKQREVVAEGGAQKRPDLWEELQALKNKRNLLKNDTSFFKFRPQKTGEGVAQYFDYKNDEVRKYQEAEKADPYTASRLEEVAEIEKGM